MRSQRDDRLKSKRLFTSFTKSSSSSVCTGGEEEEEEERMLGSNINRNTYLGLKTCYFTLNCAELIKKVPHAGRFLFSSDLVPVSVPNPARQRDHLTQTHIRKPCNVYSIYGVNPRYGVPLTVLVTLNNTDEVVAVAMLFSPAASGSSHPVR